MEGERDRLTGQVALHYETFDSDPVTGHSNFTLRCETEEGEPYLRRMRVDSKWVKLDVGFVENPGYVLIVNGGATALPVMPEPEEAERRKNLFLELIFDDSYPTMQRADMICPVGAPIVVHLNHRPLWLRVPNAKERVNVSVKVFPR